MKVELLVLKENFGVASSMAEEAQKMVEQVKATFRETEMAAAKAKLFDEKVHDKKKPFGSRMVRILTNFAE